MIRDIKVKLDSEVYDGKEAYAVRLYIVIQDGDRKVTQPWMVKEFENYREAVTFGNALREMIEA